MSYPDLTTTTLAGTVTVPAGLHPTVTRRVATTYAVGVMTAEVANASDLSDIPYPMVTNALFTGPPTPNYHITGSVRGVTVALVYQIKAENPFAAGFPQFFDIDASGNWEFFHPDNNPAHWTFTCIRIVDSLLFLPSWPSTAATNWKYSSRYAIQQQRADLAVPYPVESPAPSYYAATFPAAHVDTDFAMRVDVPSTPIGIYTSELRAYTFWDLLTNTAIGPPTWCSVPNRRAVAVGDQLDGIRLDYLTLNSPAPVWVDGFGIAPAQTFSVPLTLGTKGQIGTVRTSDNTLLARASMTNQVPREFYFYAGDTDVLDSGVAALGSAFEEVTFPPYASAVCGLAWLTRAQLTNRYTADQIAEAWTNARLIAKGISRLVQTDHGIPFAWNQITDDTGASIYNYKTGAIAWGAYYMLLAHDTIPSGYWTGAYATWKTEILAAATLALNWVYAQDPGTGLVRFGTGRIDPSTGLFDPTYQYTIYSTEHQGDAFFLYLRAAITLGDPTWTTRATTLKTAFLAHLWDDATGKLWQGCDASFVPDGDTTLDQYSWGGMALNAMGETAKALRALPRALANYGFTNVADDGTSVRGYTSYASVDGVDDLSPSIWIEGTCGLLGFQKRVGQFTASDQTLYQQLAHLQQADGSFRNFQVDDETPFGVRNFRSGQAAAWYCIARDPNVAWWTETL